MKDPELALFLVSTAYAAFKSTNGMPQPYPTDVYVNSEVEAEFESFNKHRSLVVLERSNVIETVNKLRRIESENKHLENILHAELLTVIYCAILHVHGNKADPSNDLRKELKAYTKQHIDSNDSLRKALSDRKKMTDASQLDYDEVGDWACHLLNFLYASMRKNLVNLHDRILSKAMLLQIKQHENTDSLHFDQIVAVVEEQQK